jgi:hypothetical protein
VKFPRKGRVMLLLMVSSGMYLGRMAGQNKEKLEPPPDTMRVCKANFCETLTWAKDHYDAVPDGSSRPTDRYTIDHWANIISMNVIGKDSDGREMTASLMGTLAADHVEAGRVYITGYEPGSFTATWKPGSASGSVAAYLKAKAEAGAKADERRALQRPHRVNNILIPPGASDAFASLPDDVRAILLPEHPLSSSDAMRPCDNAKEDDKGSTGVYDPILALEIGRFALRRGEYLRGRCWLSQSAAIDYNSRAVVIYGVLNLMGWAVPKDPALAFRYFDGVFKTRDPWAIYFMEQAFLNGNGVTKNLAKAGEFDTYLMLHDDGVKLFKLIGADDLAVEWRVERAEAMGNASSRLVSTCTRGPHTNTRTGAITYQDNCTTDNVVDDEALQRKLDAIDQKYRDEGLIIEE